MTPETEIAPRQLTAEELQARNRRNWALAGALWRFVALVFVITIVRFYSNVHHGL